MVTKVYTLLHRFGCAFLIAFALLTFAPAASYAQCDAPTGVNVANLTPTSATLQWEVAAADQHDYDLRVSTVALSSAKLGNSTTPGSATADDEGMVLFLSALTLQDASYALSGLTSGTHYYVYLRQDCSWDYNGSSGWASFEFTTPCPASAALPVLTGFDESLIPSCWSVGGNKPTVQSATHYGDGGNALKFTSTSSEASYLYSPIFTADAQAYYLTARVRTASAGAKVRVGVAAAEDLQNIEPIYEDSLTKTNTWLNIDVVLPEALRADLESGIEYVWVIYNAAADNSVTFYVDDVAIDHIPTCINPVGLLCADAAETSLTFSWTERGTASAWVLQYVAGTDTLTADATSNPFTLTGLDANTSYKVRVKAACAADDHSTWSDWTTAKTTCALFSVPFFQDFNTGTAIPDCWNNEHVDGTGTQLWSISSSKAYVYLTTGNSVRLTTPSVELTPGTEYVLSFKYNHTVSSTYDETLAVTLVDGGQSTVLKTFTKTDNTGTAATYEYFFTASSDHAYVTFLATGANGYSFNLDDISIKVAPTCKKPSDLVLAEYDMETAKLTWTANGSESAWLLTYKLNGTADTVLVQGTPEYVLDVVPATSYTLSALSLQALCSASDSSEVVYFNNITFATPCAAASIPFVQDFNSLTSGIPVCWDNSEGTTTTVSYKWNYYAYGATGACVRFDSYMNPNDKTNVLKSPAIAVGDLSNIIVSFKYKNPTGGAFSVYLSKDGGETFADTLLNNVTGKSAWTTFTDNFDVTAGDEVVLAFKGVSNYGSGNAYLDLDDVSVLNGDACKDPQSVLASVLTNNSVSLAIADRDSTHSVWDVVVALATVANPDSVDYLTVNQKNDTLTLPFTLQSATNYKVWVRAACADDDKSNWVAGNTFKFTDWSVLCADMTFTTDATYPWTLGREDGEWVATSGNVGIHSSTSTLTGTFTVEENSKVTVSFDYVAGGENGWDYFVLFVDDAVATPNTTKNTGNYDQTLGYLPFEGTHATGSYSLEFTEAGEHKIMWAYKKDGSGSSDIDAVKITNLAVTARNCVEPTHFNLVSVTDQAASISWNNTGADRWVVALFAQEPAGTINPASALQSDTVDATSFSFTGLTPNTQYFYYVRSLCGTSPSDWSAVSNFRTECSAVALPYTEGFEAAGAVLCWNTIGEPVVKNTSSNAFADSKSASFATDSVNVMVVSPRMDVQSLAAYELNLFAYSQKATTVTVGVIIDPSDVATYIDLATLNLPAKAWNEYSVSFADLGTEDYEDYAEAAYFTIAIPANQTVNIDAVSVALPAACSKPTALTATAVGEQTQLDWTADADAYFVEIATPADSLVFQGDVTTKPFVPQNLEGNTTYKVRVRAVCAQDSSAWTPWISFKTPCSLSALPFSENFNSYTTTASGYEKPRTVNLPDCWSFEADNSNADHCIFLTSGSSYAASGNAMVFRTSKDEGPVVAMLPSIDADNQALRIKFSYRNMSTSAGYQAPLEVGYLTTAGDTSSFVLLETLPLTTTKTQAEVIVPAATYVNVAFRQSPIYNSGYYCSFLDNVLVEVAPTCLKPSGLSAGAPTTNSLPLHWKAGASESAWQLTYKLSGSNSVDTVVVNDTTYTITGLNHSTNYTMSNITLRAICSATDSSEVVTYGNFSFATECAESTLPFSENFNVITSGIPVCWDNTEGTTTDNSYRWNYYATGKDGAGLRFNSYSNSNGKTNTLKTPTINVGDATSVIVSFDYKNPTGGDYYVFLSHDGGTTFTDTLAGSLVGVSSWTTKTLNVTVAPDEHIVLAFQGISNWGNGDAYLYLDNVAVELPAACERPSALAASAITGESATITITDAADANAWEYVVDDEEGTPVAVSSNVFSLTGLAPQTNYTVYVRRVCGAGNVSAWRSVTFMTACGVTSLPFSEDFNSLTAAQEIPVCWDNSEGDLYDYDYDEEGYPWEYYATGKTGHCVSFDSYNNFEGAYSVLKTPSISAGDLTSVKLSFAYKNPTGGDMIVRASLNGGDFTTVASLGNKSSWTDYSYIIPVTPGDVLVVAFDAISNWGDGDAYIYLDDVKLMAPPSCDVPADVVLDKFTSNTVWLKIRDVEDATAWEYALDSAMMATPVAVTDTVLMLTGLTPDSDYNLYVRRVCSEEDKSEWIATEIFTSCAPVTRVEENFDTEDALACWYSLGRTSTSYPSLSTTYQTSGTKSLYFYGYSSGPFTGIFSMPEIDGDLTDYRVTFSAMESTIGVGSVIVGVTDAIGGDITYVDTISSFTTNFQNYQFTFDSYTGEGKFPIFVVRGLQTSLYIDDIIVEEIPSCDRPQSLAVSNPTATSVDVAITDADADHTAWEVVVVAAGADVTTGTPVLVNTKVATIAGTFVDGTSYDVYVRTVCTADDKSVFLGPTTFTYVDFSSVTNVPVTGDGQYPWTISGTRLESTNQGVSSSTSDLVTTVTVPDGALGVLSFDYWVQSEASYDYLCIYINEANPTTSNMDDTFGKKGASTAVTGTYTINLTPGTYTIRWRYRKDGSGNTGADKAQIWNVNFSALSFFAPSDVHVKNLTSTSATLAWAGSDDAVSNLVRITNNDLDTTLVASADTLNLDFLEANTAYSAFVRSISASNDTTAWSARYRFTTPCDALPLPYAEDFESYQNAPSSSYSTVSNAIVPDCWSIQGNGSNFDVRSTTTYANGTNCLMGFGNKEGFIFLPALEANNAVSRIRLTYKYESNSYGKFVVGYVTGAGDGSTFVAVDTLKAVSGGTRYNYVGLFPAMQTLLPAFKYVGSTVTNWYVSLDDISIEEVAACEKPESISLINAALSQVDIKINDLDTAHHAWQVAFGPRGFDPDAQDALLVDASAQLVSILTNAPLVNDSLYSVYARTVCSDTEVGPWSNALTFKFVDYSLVADGLGVTSDGLYPWVVAQEAGINKLESTNTGHSSTVSDFKTTFVVPEGEKAELSFDYWVNGSSSYGYLVMFVDTLPTSNYSSYYDSSFGQKYGTSTLEGSTYTYNPVDGTYTLHFDEGTHTVLWRYYISSEPTGTYYTYNFEGGRKAQVWNLQLTTTAQWAPDSLHLRDLGATTATVAWNQCADVVKNEVKLGTQLLETTTDSIVLSGLTANSPYTVAVRSITAQGDTTAWSENFSFRTECMAYSLPFAEDFEGLSDSLKLPYCWDNSAGTTTTDSYRWNYYATGKTGKGMRFNSYINSTNNTNTLQTPDLNVESADQVKFSFAFKNPTGGAMKVVASRDGVDTTLASLSARYSSTWKTLEYNIPTAGASVLSLKFVSTSNYGNGDAYHYLDDIRVSRVHKADTIFDGTCAGGDYEGYGFEIPANQLPAGQYKTFTRTYLAQTDLEADTIYTIKIFVSQASTQYFTDTVCAHSAYTGYGFSIADVNPNRTTPYVRHDVNQYGCDSTISLTLHVLPTYVLDSTIKVCRGTAFEWKGQEYYEDVTLVDNLQTVAGCDSTINYHIVFSTQSEYFTEMRVALCEGDTFTFAGREVSEDGTYVETIQTAYGCDSTITVHIVHAYDGVIVDTVAVDSLPYLFGQEVLVGSNAPEDSELEFTVQTSCGTATLQIYVGTKHEDEPPIDEALGNIAASELAIAPNPVAVGQEAQILSDITYAADFQLRVFDAVGRLVYLSEQPSTKVPGMTAAGIYTVRVTSNGNTYQAKLVVK